MKENNGDKNMITIHQLMNEVKRLVKESPDNRYDVTHNETCKYTEGQCTNGSIGCIFGQALLNVGLSRSKLTRLDNGITRISDLLKTLNIEASEGQHWWCNRMQRQQDSGYQWADCLALANEVQQ